MIKKWNNPGSGTEYNGLYKSWCGMFLRIRKDKSYSDVTICNRWLSYDNFFEDMVDTWKPGLVLDKDSIKPGNRVYCPEYCKWMTQSENAKEMHTRHPELTTTNNPMRLKENRDKISGANNINATKVQCIETGEIFGSVIDAANKYNVKRSAISNAANPNQRRKYVAGYTWKYVREE